MSETDQSGAEIEARLQAFVEATTKKAPCKVCDLPEGLRNPVLKALENGTPVSILSAFLRAEGQYISEGTLRSHRKEHGKHA